MSFQFSAYRKPVANDPTLNFVCGAVFWLGMLALGVFLQTVHLDLLTVLRALILF